MELPFLDVVENSIACARFMSRVDFFSGLWSTPNFLINMYNICQTPEECVKSRLSPQTLISDIINVMKWVEPALENEKSQRGRIGDSCLGFHFFSMMQDCDHTRSYVDGTADATYTLMFIYSRRIHTNHTMMYHPPAAAEALPRRSSRLQL